MKDKLIEEGYSEYLSDLNSDEKTFLKEKFEILKELSDTHIFLEENKKFYLAGTRKFFQLVNNLVLESDRNKMWEEWDGFDFINKINDVRTINRYFSKVFFNLDNEVEILMLIVKDYYSQLIKRIKRK